MLKYERGKEQFHDNESRMRVVEPTQEGVEDGSGRQENTRENVQHKYRGLFSWGPGSHV